LHESQQDLTAAVSESAAWDGVEEIKSLCSPFSTVAEESGNIWVLDDVDR
jgi:hypothetical protein